MAERKKKNSATSTPQNESSQMDSPSKPEPDQTGAIGSGISGNAPLKTWGTYDASAGEGSKKEKEKKSRFKGVGKKFKKAFTGSKNSDHARRQEKFPSDSEEEESSEMAPADDKEHVPVRSKKESIPELSRTADVFEQCTKQMRSEESLSVEKKRESVASVEISNTELKKEMAALQEKNRKLKKKLANTTEELQRSRLDSERSVRAIEDLKQKNIEKGNNENEMHQRFHELETKNESLEKNLEEVLKIVQEKDMDIRDLKAQLQALGLKIFKANKEQLEMHSEEGIVEPSDLKEVAETLTFELKSMKHQLTRAESEHSDINMENSALTKEMKKLEEENLKLQTEAAQLKEKLEFWQQKCENEGIDNKTTAQTAELTVTMLQIDLMELTKKLQRKGNEVQAMAECRKKLEDRLLITRQERDRQHDQITSLLALKANLTEELDRYGSYVQDLGEFKEKSQQFKKALAMKITEVACLKEEKAALVKEMQSMKDEIETRKLEVECPAKDKHRDHEPKFQGRSRNVEKQRSECMKEGEVKDSHVIHLLSSNKALSETLQQRDHQIIALQNEANAIERRNRELESKLPHLPKSTQGRKRKDEESETVTELKEHIKKQSMKIVDLRREQESLSSETSQDKMRIQELEDERDKLQEDFESAREAMEQLKEEKRSLMDGKYVSQAETISGDGNSCSNLRCQALQHQVYLLQEEFEESKRRVTSFEKTVAHLQQQKNSALEQCSLAKVEAEIFKSDFEEERRDRTKAQGLLADFQNKKSIAAMYKEQDTLLRQERDGAIQERNYLKRELSKAKVELAQADGLKEGLKHHINETEEMIRQRDYYRELYEKVKPLECEVEIYKKEITQLRAHIESLMRKGKLKEKELKTAEEQEDAFAVKQEKEILSKDLERKASYPSIGNEQPKIHNKGESSYPIRRSKHNKQGFDVMLNPNASGCRFDRSGSEYQSYPALEIGDLSEAERTSLKELIKQSSSIHGGEDKDVRHDQSYLSLEVGDFSEAERTGLKESSSIDGGEDKDMRHVYQEQEDVKDMYKAMEDLGHEQQVKKVTDVHMPFDTNLICPLCRKQFRIGEIQKYKKHVDECA